PPAEDLTGELEKHPAGVGHRPCVGRVGRDIHADLRGGGTRVAPAPVGPGPPGWCSGADAETGEGGDRAAGALDDLADRGLRVAGEGLVEEDGLLEEAVH